MDKQLHIEFSIFTGEYNLYLVKHHEGKRLVGEIVFKERFAGEYTYPTCTLSQTEAKSLAAQLSRLGFVHSDDAGELAATKRHLQDMRYLAKVTNEKHG